MDPKDYPLTPEESFEPQPNPDPEAVMPPPAPPLEETGAQKGPEPEITEVKGENYPL